MANEPKTTSKTPSAVDVARETIKQMALRRVEPNPENYQEIYHEIAGIKVAPTLHHAMQKSLKGLPRETTAQITWLNRWEKMLKQEQWDELPALLADGMDAKVGMSQQWPVAIRDLLRAWDTKHVEMDETKKKETLERVLIKFGHDEQLAQKIQGLAQTWLQLESKNTDGAMVEVLETELPKATTSIALVEGDLVSSQTVATSPQPTVKANDKQIDSPASDDAELEAIETHDNKQLFEIFNTLKDIYKQSLKHGLIPRLEGYPDIEIEAQKLLKEAEKARKFKEWQQVAKHFRALLVRVEVIGANEHGIRHDLMSLLKLLVENISELVAEDQWLRGQVAVIQTILSSPLDRAQIQSAEKSLKEIIFKQGMIKHSLQEARSAFKNMLATFVDRLSHMSQTSGDYQEKISDYSNLLSETDDIYKINEILEGIMNDTHVMQTDIVHSRELLIAQRDEVMTSQERIKKLQNELTQLSEVVRVDQLTGVLNRRGLDDAIVREISRVNRTGGNLTIAMLDVDNFKQLNDTHGHQAGDSALQHLAQVIQETLRPTDVISRFGGEEFVILLPDTDVTDAHIAITRLQRTLTKRFFIANAERLLITFSAGIALYKKDEDQMTAINRADQAMYMAKKTGKNKVMTEADLDARVEVV
ncbi:MAG TPA: GGDEF domain-containing protein [Methylotenera sp.]|nr:GGDEF domain-containing protein [Methylotenera sp.]HPH04991.1 GGDEF domain-containing protein [Methylotenera sp.]HPN00253.1 GGDEF domain-containing protein [Methylotenera sp.]